MKSSVTNPIGGSMAEATAAGGLGLLLSAGGGGREDEVASPSPSDSFFRSETHFGGGGKATKHKGTEDKRRTEGTMCRWTNMDIWGATNCHLFNY